MIEWDIPGGTFWCSGQVIVGIEKRFNDKGADDGQCIVWLDGGATQVVNHPAEQALIKWGLDVAERTVDCPSCGDTFPEEDMVAQADPEYICIPCFALGQEE